MSLYDDASLVMIPSGYKDGKVYSIKPTNGDGDLTFTRSNDTATRVNSDGLIEKVRTNLLTYSQDFANAAWSKNAITATADVTTSPEGNADADKLIPSAASTGHFVSKSITGNIQTASVFAKADEYSHIALFYTVHDGRAVFDLSTGTIAETTGTVTAEIEDFGNGWYRCILSTTLTTQNQIRYYAINGTSWADFSVAGDGTSGVFLWGAQLELGDIATDYIATTTAAVSVGPVANLPRLDYLDSSCPKLLLEPQRTNLALYSEQFNNAGWTKSGATVTANATTSPDGTINADTIALGAGGFANIFQVIAVANNTSYTVSCYYKNIALTAGETFEMRYTNELAAPNNLNAIATIDLFAGTVSSEMFGTIATGYSGSVSSTITNVGNDWYRVTMTFTVGTSGANNGIFRPAVIPTAQARSFYAWGAQLEAGAYETSYIPTLSAASTRGADSASKTGISSLIGQTEGTIYFEGTFPDTQSGQVFMELNGTAPDINFQIASGLFYFFSVGQWSISAAVSPNVSYKIAAAYKNNDVVLYINGVQKGTDTSASISAKSNFYMNTRYLGDFHTDMRANQALLFPTRLSNAELASLTSL